MSVRVASFICGPIIHLPDKFMVSFSTFLMFSNVIHVILWIIILKDDDDLLGQNLSELHNVLHVAAYSATAGILFGMEC